MDDITIEDNENSTEGPIGSSNKNYHNVYIVGSILFAIIMLIGAILIVCLTMPEQIKSCESTFKSVVHGNSFQRNSNPYSVATGDFNHDNLMDIVVANSGADNIGIFLNYGNNTFSSQITLTTEDRSRPVAIVSGDFNNDTHLDVAVANHDTHSIIIFLGYGNGSFKSQIPFSVGASRPFCMAVGDINNDFCLDIVVCNNGLDNIGIFLGYGDGTFMNQLTYFTGYDSSPYSVVVNDFNNDSYPDIAVANYGTNNIAIFFGYGNGKFNIPITYSTGEQSRPYSIAANDFNHDGQLDIAVANSGTNNVGIFLCYKNGSFATQITYSILPGSRPYSIIIGDFNQDNYSDIAVSNYDTDNIGILIGYGNGSFAKPTVHSTGTDSNPFGITLGDFNNDNQSDIAVVNYGTNMVFLFLEYRVIQSPNPTMYSTGVGSLPFEILAADMNNDSQLDLVVSNSGTGTVGIFLGYGNGSFQEQITTLPVNGSNLRGIFICDLDNDQRMDIIVAISSDESLGILYGYGNGSFARAVTYFLGSASSPRWITVNDFNNDNHLDIAYSDHGTHNIGMLLGYGNRTFGNLKKYSSTNGSDFYGIASGDVNNDNRSDIVVPNLGTSSIDIYFGSEDGNLIYFTSYSTEEDSSPSILSVIDLNNDNYLDIIVANTGTHVVGVFFGFGNGSFDKQITYSTGFNSKPLCVIIADFNDDGSLDIAVANSNTDNIGILLGNRQGYFGKQTIYNSGLNSNPYSTVSGDFNKDNRLDIAVANYGTNNIAILLGHPVDQSQHETKISTHLDPQSSYSTVENFKNLYQSNTTVINGSTDNTPVLLGDYYADFLVQTSYSTGSSAHPYSIVIGDLNNDRQMDIAVTNFGNGNLGILLGYGNGSFTSEIIYPIDTGSNPSHIILHDLNRDDQLDIVVTDSIDDSITVFLGNANGTVLRQVKYSTGSGSNPSNLAIDNLNNDTYLDLIVTNKKTDTVGIFFGLDYTYFKKEKPCETNGNTNPRSVAVGDFNNDGYLDIVSALTTADHVAVFFGYGNGTFSAMVTYADVPSLSPYMAVAGDFNNDNQTDIAIAGQGLNSISVILGYGNGSFSKPILYLSGPNSRPYSIAVGDFNNDDNLDIAVANYGDNTVGVFFGYGNGTFENLIIISVDKGSRPRSITVFDVNNDNQLDIIVANSGKNNVGVFFGYGNKRFSMQMIFSTGDGSTPKYAIASDFNKDGMVDLAVANYGTGYIGILYGNNNGSFGNFQVYATDTILNPTQLSLGDFNNDNQTDIIVIASTSKHVGILFGYSDGTFASISSFPLEENSYMNGVAVGDFNNDNHLDFTAADTGTNTIRVCLADGMKPFGGQAIFKFSKNSQPSAVFTGHFNNDNYLDIAVANNGTSNIGILFGYGNRTFSNVTTFSTGDSSHPSSLAVGDFNNDSLTDIVVANSNADNVVVLSRDIDGNFTTLKTYSMGKSARPISIAVSDFNRDNKMDIAVANYGTNNICLLFGLGDGNFTNQTWYSLGYNSRPNWITFEDVNNDGRKDIGVAMYGTDDIKILLNIC